jgi:putative membrane protein
MLATGAAALGIWSFAGAADKGVWAFEVAPITLLLAAAFATVRWFRWSDLAFVLLVLFFAVQCLGGRYTFAEVPFPRWLSELLGLQRNPADRIGHFCQGLVPAIVLREWLRRRVGLPPGAVVGWLVAGCCLGFSAAYELLEMAVVLLWYPDQGPEWLGMQGDPWDAQWDMTMALGGAVAALVLLRGLHERSMARVAGAVGTRGLVPVRESPYDGGA